MRERVGIAEIANFAKYEVTGEEAEAWLSHLMTNTMPRTGRLVLTQMLNERGRLIGDFTIAKADVNRFMIWGSSGAQIYHMRWFERHFPGDGSVSIHRFGQTLVGLSIARPRSRDVLEQLADIDVSKDAFRFMDYREMDVAGCPCRVNRMSYTGDLGYEIWMEPAYERTVYHALKAAGENHGIVDFGMRALLSMRLEKNFPTWFAELRPIYRAYEGSMDRFVKLSKNDFIGRQAAAEEQERGPESRRVSLIIDADDTDVMGDEPVWARVGDEDYGLVSQTHGYGATRFDADADADGNATPAPPSQRDGDWRVVGWVTSGGYDHWVEKSLAQAYVPAELAEVANGGCSRSKSSAVSLPPASRSNRLSIRPAKGCGLKSPRGATISRFEFGGHMR